MRTTENLLGGRPKVRIKKKDFRPEVSGNTDINPNFGFNVVSINRMIVETERRLSHSHKGSTGIRNVQIVLHFGLVGLGYLYSSHVASGLSLYFFIL